MSKRVITQGQRQTAVSKDSDLYQLIETAEKKERERRQEMAQVAVYWHFLDDVRPKLKVGETYSFTELRNLYSETHSEDVGLFAHLLLNNSKYLDICHTCKRPSYIIFTKKPTNGVESYLKNRDEVIKKARNFMAETGLKVELPPKVDEDWLSMVDQTAQDISIEKLTKIADTELTSNMFRTLEKMGYEYKRIKTASAFWIEN